MGGIGKGLLQIDAGGLVSVDSGRWVIGNSTTGDGTVEVDGEMRFSNWDAALSIGNQGKGIMNVNPGGQVHISGYAWIGERGGQGELNVSGAGALFETTGSGSFRVGEGAGSGRVVIVGGGEVKVNGGDVSVGRSQFGNNGSGFLSISGAGSKLISTGSGAIDIGSDTALGQVVLTDGGTLDANASQITVGTGSRAGSSLSIGAARGDAAQAAGTISQNNAISLGGNGELVFNHTDASYVFGSSLSGTGSLYKEEGATTTILDNDSAGFSGNVIINAGALQLGNGSGSGSIGSANVAIGNGAQLKIDRTGVLTISGVISGAGKVEQNGTGTTIVSGANTYSGGTLVSAGTLQGNTVSLQGDIVNHANLVFDQTADGAYSGTLSGTGTLTKQGSAELTLQSDASIGVVNHNAGTLNIDANRTLLVTGGHMNMATGTTLGVDVSSSPAVQVSAGGLILAGGNTLNITGYSPTVDTGTYTLVTTTSGVTGGVATTVAGAGLHTFVDLDTYLIGSAWVDASGKNILAYLELVWNNNDPLSAHGTFNIASGESFDVGVALADNTISGALGFGWNGQDLTKKGAGALVLNGVNTYTGHTDVQDGLLVVGSTTAHSNAQIASDVDVRSGATLGGHGRINGTATIHGGGMLAPGNSVGILTVADAVFLNGSVFQVEVNPDGTADRLVADSSLGGAGTVTIHPGAALDIVAGAGSWNPSTSYLIIDTDGGVNGQFDSVASNLAFLTETVNYTVPNQVWLRLERNDTGLGDLDGTYNENSTGKGIESLGGGNEIYDTIIGMSRDQALDAYNNLSGEIHGSARSAVLTNRYARDAVNQHLFDGNALLAGQIESQRALWISTWGHDGYLRGDGNAARLDHQGWGFLVGADAYSDGSTAAGVAVGYEQTDVKTRSGRSSDADMDAIHLLAYGRTSAGPVDIRGGVGYSWLDVDTTRYVNVGALQSRNRGSYDGSLIQAYVEGSHTFDLNEEIDVTPYLNVAYQSVRMDNFTESGDHAQLHGNSGRDHLVTMTTGARGIWQLGEKIRLYGDLGWQYSMGDVAPHTRLNFIGGSTYTVKGVKVDRNSVMIGLGGDYQIQPHMRLSAGYEGQFGNQSRDHALKMRFEYRF